METAHFFGGGGDTDIRTFTLFVILVASLLLFCLPKRHIVAPLLFTVILIPLDQQIVLAGVHLTMSRMFILFAWIRVMIIKAQEGWRGALRWTQLDTCFSLYCFFNALTYAILWVGESGAIINRLGFLYNACGMYFLIRFYIAGREDLARAGKALVCVFILISMGMIDEKLTGRNVFSHLGGVPEAAVVRDGKIRAEGPFAHPLTAGAIGSAIMPVAFGMWWVDKKRKKGKGAAIAGIIASVAVGLTSMSSTAPLTLTAGVVGLCFWKIRRHMRVFRWLLIVTLVSLHLIMKAPVWALIARVDLTGSSSGYQRYVLVDRFIRRFAEWCLIGTQTTSSWGWDMWDTINSYVAAGTGGGLITFALFVGSLVIAFRSLGNQIRRADPGWARQLWVLGSMLFAHTVAFFGIVYFDQSQFVWYSCLAMISSAVSLRPAIQRPAQATISERVDTEALLSL